MQDYEKLGVFYLGREYDVEHRTRRPELLLYDARHLVTHGLVVGMTGSGKTGLCVALIEEAAMDGIPAIVIDPKGDLGNLLLTFPELRAEDFAPWINPDDARRKGLSEADYAAQQAESWRRGLSEWGQDGDRIRRLRAAAEFAIYTPGSSAGRPLSILAPFAAPPAELIEDAELFQDRIASTVAGLLGLVGVEADPVRGREAILLSHVLQQSWSEGRALDLATLIQQVQAPPFQRVGVLDLESFYPAKERFELAMQLNHLLASPAFTAWSQGEPLDVNRLLFGENGKPRIAILSIAHLGDAERMFFVTLLLNQVLGWMRAQSGTSSLRALVYMDEIAGYFPPVANPPSKLPLLTMLKQARAFGVGVVLATQNPVDLDYKGLANIGTWFVGRLQTDRDKARVIEGLEGVAAGQGGSFDGKAASQTLAALGSRVFLLHSVHEDEPTLFESRWAMSYLRGPLSREQIRALTSNANGRASAADARRTAAGPGPGSSRGIKPRESDPTNTRMTGRPVLPPEVKQVFAPLRATVPDGATLLYQPRLLGAASVRFADARLKVDVLRDLLVVTEITERAVPVDWGDALEPGIGLDHLSATPAEADYAPVPAAATRPANYAGWTKEFASWVATGQTLKLWRSPSLQAISRPDEDERGFRIRLQQLAREQRDATAEKLRQTYAPKLAALQERLRRAEAARQREATQANRAKLDTIVSLGSTLLGAFLGRKAISSGSVGRAASTVRSASRAMDQAGDVGRASETVEAVARQLEELEATFHAEMNAAMAGVAPASEPLDVIELRPARGGIQVRLVALVWLPFLLDNVGVVTPGY